VEVRPTAAWLRENIAEYDHIFYSGHGHANGLVLVDNEGREEVLTALQISAFPALARQPSILLSACDSANEIGSASADFFSVASCLIRIGSRYVLGTLWLVRDEAAARFSRAFYADFVLTNDPPRSFRAAVDSVRAAADGATPPPPVRDWGAFIVLSTA
jgi:hypothetical protein